MQVCTQLLIKHVAIWSWALDTLTAYETDSDAMQAELSLRAAKLLWSVRRSIRVFYESEESISRNTMVSDELREKTYHGKIIRWAGIAAQRLESLAKLKTGDGCDRQMFLVAAAMCWYVQAHARLRQQYEPAFESCTSARKAIEIAQKGAAGRLGEKAGLFSWKVDLCCAEVLALHGRMESEGKRGGTVWKHRGKKKVPETAISSLEHAEIKVSKIDETLNKLLKEKKGTEGPFDMEKGESIEAEEMAMELSISLPMLKCEVLNSLGNACRVAAVKSTNAKVLLAKAVEYYKSAATVLGTDKGDFVSHNIGLTLLGQYVVSIGVPCTKPDKLHGNGVSAPTTAGEGQEGQTHNTDCDTQDPLEKLRGAEGHLHRAVHFRRKIANSKNIDSVLRLCDSYRTLDNVLFYLRAMKTDCKGVEEAVEVPLESPSSESVDAQMPPSPSADLAVVSGNLQCGRMAVLGQLRRCARTWDDRAKAIYRVCMWMKHAGPFNVPEGEEYGGRRRVRIQWRQSADDPSSGLNKDFVNLASLATQAELAGGLLRVLTGLRFDAGATMDLTLSIDPVAECLCDLAAQCVARCLCPVDFIRAVAALMVLVHGGESEGCGAWDRLWRSGVAATLRDFIQTETAPVLPSASPSSDVSPPLSPTAVLLSPTAGKEGVLGAGAPTLVNQPSMYLARLVHLRDEDLTADERAAVLRASLAAASGWVAVLSWNNAQSGKRRPSDEGTIYRELALIWLATQAVPVSARGGLVNNCEQGVREARPANIAPGPM